MKQLAALLIAFVAMSGCGGGAGSVVGKWKGSIESGGAKKDDPAGKLAQAFGDMMGAAISFEFKSDKTFTGSIIFPIEGTYTVEGNKVSLKVEKMAGMAPKAGDANNDKPLVFTIAPDGKTMSAKDETGKNQGELKLVKE